MSSLPPKPAPGCLLQFRNCQILRDHKIYRDHLWVRNGKIVDPEKIFFDEGITADVQIDCNNCIIAPGFIDTQLNGAVGVDFSDDHSSISEGVQKVAKHLLETGVTSFCPTVITSPPEVYKKILPQIKKCPGSAEGAGVLGIHLEGPFISCEKKGMHPEECITSYDNGFSDLEKMYGSFDNAALLTLAPELPRTEEVIKECVKRGIVVSVGHSMAKLEQGEAAVCQGASFITHLFNAMLPFHHRDPHLVGLLTSERIPKDRTLFFGLISDGIHTHPAALRIAHRVHPDGLVLITDAIRAMGLPEGKYTFGQQDVVIKGKTAMLVGTDTLAGSIARLDLCVRHFAKTTGCGAVLALEAASLHPAQMLGISHQKGTLDIGADADFILLNDSLEVKATYIAGQRVWQSSGFTLKETLLR
ncbi:N-acetylglucosamine-6-phosphate deacetylase-like [Babylonia areolata]|uniref:N-acetylglucosamine-6-phosphate deacetylase-like n=1 Tax=Babylonia areolata TaxID=304850 RepID=UPI003FD503C4